MNRKMEKRKEKNSLENLISSNSAQLSLLLTQPASLQSWKKKGRNNKGKEGRRINTVFHGGKVNLLH